MSRKDGLDGSNFLEIGTAGRTLGQQEGKKGGERLLESVRDGGARGEREKCCMVRV